VWSVFWCCNCKPFSPVVVVILLSLENSNTDKTCSISKKEITVDYKPTFCGKTCFRETVSGGL
jgi:hypothetical protein